MSPIFLAITQHANKRCIISDIIVSIYNYIREIANNRIVLREKNYEHQSAGGFSQVE